MFQPGRVYHLQPLLDDLSWAVRLSETDLPVRRVFGLSAGSITALAFCLARAAILDPHKWGGARWAMEEWSVFLKKNGMNLSRGNLNPWYGFYNLNPLMKFAASWLKACCQKEQPTFADLPEGLYLCAGNHDGILSLFGQPDPTLQFQYQHARVGPPQNAPVLDVLRASLSSLLWYSPGQINGNWYKDCRPAVVDAGAILADLPDSRTARMYRSRPFVRPLEWELNFITSSFVMHSQYERNQVDLARVYLDLRSRHESLLENIPADIRPSETSSPSLHHIDLPYVGSTEASTNMRQSVANKDQLIQKFSQLLAGQLERIPFDQDSNLIYGAGGFSGILAGLVAARAINNGFKQKGGKIKQIYGVSAGVINGFFHAVELAAADYPELYRPAAARALSDLEDFVAHLEPSRVVNINRDPRRLWRGWANLHPLKIYLCERLKAYTGVDHPEDLTFDDIHLPMTVTVAREDGYNDFFGMTHPTRKMVFAGREMSVKSIPIIQALIAGWSMNTYVEPALINGHSYQDGGGPYYDIALFAACFDASLTNLINIHLDEPEGHTYNLPARPHLLKIVFDTHNYTFPEERRRMRLTSDLLFEHFRLRASMEKASLSQQPPPDFRQNWIIQEQGYADDSTI